MWNQPARVSTGITNIYPRAPTADSFIGFSPDFERSIPSLTGAAYGSVIGFSPRGPSSTASPDGGFPAAHRSRAEQKRVASTRAPARNPRTRTPCLGF